MMDTSTSNPASYAFLAMIGLLAVFASHALYKKYNNDIDNDLPEYPSAFLAHGLLWSGGIFIIISILYGIKSIPDFILLICATVSVSGAGIIFAVRRLTWEVRLMRHEAAKNHRSPPDASPAKVFLQGGSPSGAAEG
jgi:hypothetical protein